MTELDSFAFGSATGAYGSCSAVLDGKMYIFGGLATIGAGWGNLFNQISEIDQCGTRRIGDLPIWFFHGGCNTFETNDRGQFVLLCFGTSWPAWDAANMDSWIPKYFGSNATLPTTNGSTLPTACYK